MSSYNLFRLYERVNQMNTRAAVNSTGKTYWTVVVLYNHIIYERDQDGAVAIHEVVGSLTEGERHNKAYAELESEPTMIKAPLPAGVNDTPELREKLQRDITQSHPSPISGRIEQSEADWIAGKGHPKRLKE